MDLVPVWCWDHGGTNTQNSKPSSPQCSSRPQPPLLLFLQSMRYQSPRPPSLPNSLTYTLDSTPSKTNSNVSLTTTSGLKISPPLQESPARNGKTPVKHHQNSRGPRPRSLFCNNLFYSSANTNRSTTTMVRHFHPTHYYQHTRRQHHQHTRRRHRQHPPRSQ
jgi:hypothetical protein